MNDPNPSKRLSAKQFQPMIGSRPLPLAGFLWFLTSVCLLGQSTIQFTGRGFTVDETVGQVVLPVERSNDLETEVAAEFFTVEDTATAGQDFTAVSGTLSFGAGVTQQTITVPILNDGLVESTERFLVMLTNATGGAVLGSTKGIAISIRDNDLGVRFAPGSYQTVEDIGEIRLVVYRGNDGDQPVTVDYSTIDGTALAGTDYEAASGTLTFEADDTFQEITVAILNDGVNDPDKSFQVQLSHATNGGLGTPSVATVTIQDPTPVIYTQPAPASQTVTIDQSQSVKVKIQVSAKGARMQWQHRVGEGEFTDLQGATGQVLEFHDVTVEQAGEYRLVVSSSTGEIVISQVAQLGVVVLPFTKITEGAIVKDSEGSIYASWADYDGDGYADLFVANSSFGSHVRNSIYRNNGDGTFTKILTNAPATAVSICWHGLWTDFDNDGDPDLHVLGALDSPDKFYRNDGEGGFTELTPEFVATHSYGEEAAWCDFDNDGWLDVFIPRNNGRDLLYRGSPTGNFQSMSQAEVGSIVAYSSLRGGLPFDYDDDGWPDLLVIPFAWSDGLRCRLHHNEGYGVFREDTDSVFANQPSTFAGGSTLLRATIGDFDNDGDLDVFAANGQDGYRARLYRNDGNGVFTDVAADAGVDRPLNAMSATVADYDNDGDLDILVLCASYFSGDPMRVGNDDVLFQNRGDGTFDTFQMGSPLMTQDRLCLGYWVDYDNDGFLDLFVTAGNAANEVNYLYRNRLSSMGNANNWLKVKLVGKASNSMGVGAKLRVEARIGANTVRQLRPMMAPLLGDHQAFTAHFGLGDATKVDTLRIEWPSGIVQELKDVAVNQQLQVVESQGLILPEPLSVQTSALDAEGVFHATVNCPVDGAVCVLESSADLDRWTKVKVGTVSGGTVELTDAHAAQSPTRFYRVLVP